MPYTQLHSAETQAELATKYSTSEALAKILVADAVCPVTPTVRKLVRYWTHDRKNVATISDSRVAPDGLPNRRSLVATSTTAEVEPYALHDTIPLSDLSDAEPGLDLEADTIEFLTHDLLLGHESRVATAMTTAASYASANKVTLGTAWTSVLSTPIADIQTGKRACAVPPNFAVCDEATWDALARHPDIINTLRGTSGVVNGLAAQAEVARYFGLDAIHVGKVKYNTANPTATASYSTLWPSGKFLLGKSVAQPRAREIVTARTYRYGGDNGMTMSVTTVVDEKPGTKGVLFIKVALEELVQLTAADTGYLISGAV